MIREMKKSDASTLSAMALEIWDSDDRDELEKEFIEMADDDDATCFIKEVFGEAVGFANVAMRHDYVEGCETSPVAYLEAIYVSEAHRMKGYAKDLVRRCEAWAKERGITEFASDCLLENTDSLHFHIAIGFTEVARTISFKKDL